jgi:hypothetical protein
MRNAFAPARLAPMDFSDGNILITASGIGAATNAAPRN